MRQPARVRPVPRHVGWAPRLPAHLVAGRRDRGVEAERVPAVVETARCGRVVSADRDQPDLRLVDHGDDERAVRRDGRRGARSLERGEPTWRPDSPLQPQFAVDAHVHHARAVGQPVEAAAAHRAPRPRIGRRGEHPFRTAVDVDDRHRRPRPPALHERDRSAVRGEPGLGELTARQDQLDRDRLDRSGSSGSPSRRRNGLDRHGARLRRDPPRRNSLDRDGPRRAHCTLTAKEVPDD